MARIIDGIKELLGKGKDDDDDLPEYRPSRYDQAGSNRIYGYPADGTARGRSGYRRPFGEALDDNYIRNRYDTRPSPRGGPEYREPYGTEYASPRGAEYASPRGAEYASNRAADYVPRLGAEYASNRAADYVSPRGVEYARGAEYASTRGGEYASTRGAEYASPRGTEYQRPYVGSEAATPRGEYLKVPLESPRDSGYQTRGSSRRDASSDSSVIEFMVPMCCNKCKEKVKEELSEVEGVESVRCDPPNSRVIVTGDDSIDVERCLKKAERAVKKKCEVTSTDARDSARYYPGTRDRYPESASRVSTPSGRPSLGRLPSFASGKVTQYDGVGPRGQDYDAKDYNGSGFRRMPSFGTHRHNEAEYITSYDQRPEPQDSRRGVYADRRMPSFNQHRHHDAEYITTGDRNYSPRTFYESGGAYSSAYNERPVFRSQVSFSNLPVENPNYVKRISY
jgi:copper chaperone CopZ